ncbi:Uncharacterised protein [Candidatus Gugararchaeum adminiculabundum]|nr:Uncharacterised protein [Candidatus Gugararchaeum adminiculabundum]
MATRKRSARTGKTGMKKGEESEKTLMLVETEAKDIVGIEDIRKLKQASQKRTALIRSTNVSEHVILGTIVDRMIARIYEKKRVGLDEVCKELSINVKHGEKIAKMLEESGLVQINYPFFTPWKTMLKATQENIRMQKKIMRNEKTAQVAQEISIGLKQHGEKLASSEKEILERIRSIEEFAASAAYPEHTQKVNEKISEIHEMNRKLDSQAQELERKLRLFAPPSS